VPEHESAKQIRDEIRSNHPLLVAISDNIETMDERETLKYTLGVEIDADLLKLHAPELIINQTAGGQ
jgi:predicted alternative tryptophan synthase beta-subunit